MIDKLICRICNHPQLQLRRNTPTTLEDSKNLGDTAAHDHTCVTPVEDIEQRKLRIRHAESVLRAKAIV
jgi:hypothetical protein